MPARFDPTFASDLTGRGFVGLFLGLSRSKAETATGNAQALCCRAYSPSDRALCCRAFSPSDRAATRASALRAHFKNGRGRSLRAVRLLHLTPPGDEAEIDVVPNVSGLKHPFCVPAQSFTRTGQ